MAWTSSSRAGPTRDRRRDPAAPREALRRRRLAGEGRGRRLHRTTTARRAPGRRRGTCTRSRRPRSSGSSRRSRAAPPAGGSRTDSPTSRRSSGIPGRARRYHRRTTTRTELACPRCPLQRLLRSTLPPWHGKRRRRAGCGAPDRAGIRVVRAPGRVNLIGEHTDYNDGFVMPAAIGLEIRTRVLPTDERRVTITLDDDRRDGGVRPRRDRAADPAGSTTSQARRGRSREAGQPIAGSAASSPATCRRAPGCRRLRRSSWRRRWRCSADARRAAACRLRSLGQRAENALRRRPVRRDGPVRVGGRRRRSRRSSSTADRWTSRRAAAAPRSALVVCHSGSPHGSRRPRTTSAGPNASPPSRRSRRCDPSVRSLRDVDAAAARGGRRRMDAVLPGEPAT